MRRGEAQQQRQNPVRAGNGSYLRSPFDINQRFAQLAARQVEQGGTRRHLLATAHRSDDDRDGLEKANTVMRPWSRAGLGASRLSVKEKNMQRTLAEKIYGDDNHLYTKSSDAHAVDASTASAEEAKAKKKMKQKKGVDGASKRAEATVDDEIAEEDGTSRTTPSSGPSASVTTSHGMARQFALDVREREAMQKMVPSHVRKQRRDQLRGTREMTHGPVGETDDEREDALRPQLGSCKSLTPATVLSPPVTGASPRAASAKVEYAEGSGDNADDDVLQEVPVRESHKRGREDDVPVNSRPSSLAAPKNRLQQLQAMRDAALLGKRGRR